jgi:hypothetical protein
MSKRFYCSVYLLYWYNSANTDAEGAARGADFLARGSTPEELGGGQEGGGEGGGGRRAGALEGEGLLGVSVATMSFHVTYRSPHTSYLACPCHI